MGKRSSTVRPLFGSVQNARGTGGIALLAAALLLGCSGKVESASNGDAGQGGAIGAGSPNSSGGSAAGSFGGDDDSGSFAGRTSGGVGGAPRGDTGGVPGGDAGGGVAGRSRGGAGGAPRGGAGGALNSGAGRGGALGHAGSSGGGNAAGTSLGLACTSDTQCGTGMVCATANGTLLGTGGPSHGMCTMPCTPGETKCASLKAGAECFEFGSDPPLKAYCLDACVHGDPAVDEQTKCAGRSDFVCADLGEGTPSSFCVPHCRSDAECGAGLFCDKRGLLGLCSKTKRMGAPVGTPCSPSSTIDPCEGQCVRTSETGALPETGACVELCSGGSECMYSSGSAPTPGGFCGGSLSNDVFAPIDLGYCLANCSCTGDCQLPGDLCRKWPDAAADLASALGAPGVCYPTASQSVELTCSAGGANGGSAGKAPQTAGASGTGF